MMSQRCSLVKGEGVLVPRSQCTWGPLAQLDSGAMSAGQASVVQDVEALVAGRTLERRLEERSSGRSVARMSTERSVQSSRKMGSLEVPLSHTLAPLSTEHSI